MSSQPCKSPSVAQMLMPVSHYAARLIEAGDLPSLARRLTVIAYEDIGLANPEAQIHTVTALGAAQRLVPRSLAFSLPMSSLIWPFLQNPTQPM